MLIVLVKLNHKWVNKYDSYQLAINDITSANVFLLFVK